MTRYYLFIISFFFIPLFAQAQNLGVVISPNIIDEKVMAGDILKYDVKIKNESDGKVDLYAMVNDMSESDGEMAFVNPGDLDRDVSIARWIKFKRGVIDLMPGSEAVVALEINISSTAKPGRYFARIALPSGSNRTIAEENMLKKSYPQLNINISVDENIIEKAQVKDFSSLKNVYLLPPASFKINLNNFGNKTIEPRGNIYIYNRRGEEISSLDVNPDVNSVASGDIWEQVIHWEDAKGFGKFKAKLELEYGKKDKRDLQDTVFFWFFPWKILLIFFSGTFLFLVLMITWIFKRTYIHHQVQATQRVVPDNNTDGILNLKK